MENTNNEDIIVIEDPQDAYICVRYNMNCDGCE